MTGIDVAPRETDALLDARALSKLKWRCRRGMLENDLFLERFFRRHEASLTVSQGAALHELMGLSDNDLLDLHLGRKALEEIDPALGREDVREVVGMLRDKH